MSPVDLRSDTVTRPTPEMRRAMADAEVGDDVYGDDPTVRALEERVAALLGKERALFVPSGTMSNQLALLVQTRRGDEIVIGEGAHCAWYESGAAAAWSGVQFAVAGRGGLFSVEEMEAAVKPAAYYLPRTRMVTVENTNNAAGGRVFPHETAVAIAERARSLGLAVHLDGARLWNAAIASGHDVATLARPFDTVSVCFSKGLGAPVGSALCGPAALLVEAHRCRKMLGGGMRQAGILAAGALHALEHHRARLADDHASARELARIVGGARGAVVDASAVETNMVLVDLEAVDAQALVNRARAAGVLLGATGPRRLRAVTHLDAPLERVRWAAGIVAAEIEGATRAA